MANFELKKARDLHFLILTCYVFLRTVGTVMIFVVINRLGLKTK